MCSAPHLHHPRPLMQLLIRSSYCCWLSRWLSTFDLPISIDACKYNEIYTVYSTLDPFFYDHPSVLYATKLHIGMVSINHTIEVRGELFENSLWQYAAWLPPDTQLNFLTEFKIVATVFFQKTPVYSTEGRHTQSHLPSCASPEGIYLQPFTTVL